MRLLFWVTALAVLGITWAKNSTTKAKPKRQLDNIRSPQNLQYSLILPHSRVAQFRSLSGNDNRRISHGVKGKLPPYAVQMEPVVQYSQKDPLYDRDHDNVDNTVDNKNQVYAQSKILNVQDSSLEANFGPPYGSLPTAPLYSYESQPQYYDGPEPIIEIIIKESNESLPAPPSPPPQKKKKEPVHVFYVKYSKDPHSKDKVVYEKPIAAITPPTNDEEEHEQYVTVTPEPVYTPPKTTTLRAIIKPESETYHSDSSVKITFGNEGRHYSGRHEHVHHNEDHEETAPRPAIAYPNQHPQANLPIERSASPKPQFHESATRPTGFGPTAQPYKATVVPQAQNRIQFQPQPQYFPTEQQLPKQGPSAATFRTQSAPQLYSPRHPFGSSPTFNAAFSNGPITHFANPTPSSPAGPVFPTAFPRINNGPASTFHSRQAPQPPLPSRSNFNGPPKVSFHSGPQRPFQPPQSKQFFDEAKYLQDNYHTITTEQVEPPKEQLLPNKQLQTFNSHLQTGPSPAPLQFQDHRQTIPVGQQLPQQRPPQRFADLNKPSLSINPNNSPFFNLKPSPPHIEDNRPSFHQVQQQPHQQFSFHQGPQPSSRPPSQISAQQSIHNTFSSPIAASPSPLPQNQFLPQPSSPTFYNFQQPSPTPDHFPQGSPSERPHFQPIGPTERSNFQQHNPSERPFSQSYQDNSNFQHRLNVGQFVQNGGELVPAIPKYEQHYTVNGHTSQSDISGFSGLSQPSPSPTPSPSPSPSPASPAEQFQQQYDAEQEHVRLQLAANVQKQQEEIQRLQTQLLYTQQQHQQHQQDQLKQQQNQHRQQQDHLRQQQEAKQQEQRYKQQQQDQHIQQQHQQHQQDQHKQQQNQHRQQQDHLRQQQEAKQQEQLYKQQHEEQHREQQDQLRQQQEAKQQEQRYKQQQQQQNNYNQQQNNYNQHNYNQQDQATSPRSQYIQERSRPHASSTAVPNYYQSSSRSVEIKPTTPKYSSSTANSISSTAETKQEEKKKKPTIELPDEVPDDLRQQLLSSGILDNADISVLDYDKVGETPLDSLPPDQLANFFSAGGAQQIASSEYRPIIVAPNGDRIQSRLDEDIDEDQEEAASENIATYVAPPSQKQAVEMKVVHFDPKTSEGQNIAKEYVQENATQLDPVALNDKKYNRYLPLKVSGNQFPLPDVLKGRKITSVVVLAPVETEVLNNEHKRTKRAPSSNLKGIKFVAGESLQDLLRKPTKDNFEKWLNVEKETASDLQSIVLLVTGNEGPTDDREIFMYDISSGNVNKLSGELSNAFVEAAENNSLSKDIGSLAIEGEGTPEKFNKNAKEDIVAEGSENVPFLVDLSGLSLDEDPNNQVSISSGYSKMKQGRSLRRH